jgi:ABC-2 type transport system permease protein
VVTASAVMGGAVTFSALVYGVPVSPGSILALLLTLAVGSACFSALGLAVTAASPSADASLVIVNILVWPPLFASNVFIPVRSYPAWLDVPTGLLPVRHLAAAVRTALAPAPGGTGLPAADLGALVLWGLIGLALALRFFTWEPRQQSS